MTSKPETLRIGVVGAGAIATSVHIPVIKNIPDAQIVWVADVSDVQGHKVARYNRTSAISIAELETQMPDCDVVLLAIPLLPRNRYFELLQEKPVTVLSEKPLALNFQDHKRYASLYGDARLSICYARRFNGTSRLLRDIILQRPFGDVKAIRVAEGGLAGRTGGGGRYQDESVTRGGGITLNLACHALDCVIWVTGATSYEIRSRDIAWDGDTDRRVKAQIHLGGIHGPAQDGATLDIVVTNLDAVSNTMEFEFESATLRCPIASSDRVDIIGSKSPLGGVFTSTVGARNSMESYHQMWSNVLFSHRKGVPSEVSATSNLLMAEIIDELVTRSR